MSNPLAFLRRGHRPDAEELSAYLDGRLDASASERARLHIGACPVCAQRVEELGRVRSSLTAMPEVTLPRSFRLRQADVEGRVPAAGGVSPWLKAMPALSAAALVLFAVVVLADPGGESADEPGLSSSESFYDGRGAARDDAGGEVAEDETGGPPAPAVPDTSVNSPTPAAGEAISPDAADGDTQDGAGGLDAGPASPGTSVPDESADNPAESDGDDAEVWAFVQFGLLAVGVAAGAVTLWFWWKQRT